MNTRFFSKILFASVCAGALIYATGCSRSHHFHDKSGACAQCSAPQPGHGQMGVPQRPDVQRPQAVPGAGRMGRGMMGRQGDQQGPAMAMRGMGRGAQMGRMGQDGQAGRGAQVGRMGQDGQAGRGAQVGRMGQDGQAGRGAQVGRMGQDGQAGGPGRGLRGEGGAQLQRFLQPRAIQELGLTDKQVEQIRKIAADVQQKSREATERQRADQEKLRSLMEAKSPDTKAIMEQIDKQGRDMAAVRKLQVGALLEARKVLTPEQLEKASQLRSRQEAMGQAAATGRREQATGGAQGRADRPNAAQPRRERTRQQAGGANN